MSEPTTTGPTEDSVAGWQGRDGAAQLLRFLITLTPLVVAAAVSIGSSFVLPAPSSWSWTIVRILAIAALSMTAVLIVERAARKLLPLTTLLRLSLVFPDRTPSRFKLALKAGSGRRMERALTEARTNGLSQDRAEAAEQLVLLSTAIGKHDRRTRGHSERVRLYAELLAEELHLDKDERHKLQWAALIHDMGKITVPPEILNKRGKPNDGEWSILQNHPARGEELVAPVADWLGEWVHAVGGHHERWDGTGYPRRLAGSDIPRAAAMVAVADSFEVMTAVRSYKSAMSLADARAELTRCSGTHFSPDMVRAFLNVSLPKLRRAGGLLASLAHVPFIGNALTVSAKAPEAWGYGLTNIANAGGSAVAAAAVTGVLMTAPASADAHRPGLPVAAAAAPFDSAQPLAASPSQHREDSAGEPTLIDLEADSATLDAARTAGTETEPDAPRPTSANSPPFTDAPVTSPAATPPALTPPPVSPPPLNPPTASPPPAPPSTPGTIEDLIAMLEPDADAFGDRGSNLLNKLHDLQRERGESFDTAQPVKDRAGSLIEDVDKWLEEGRLDPAIGDVAQRLLAPLAGG